MSKLEDLVQALADEIASKVLAKVQDSGKTVTNQEIQSENDPKQEKHTQKKRGRPSKIIVPDAPIEIEEEEDNSNPFKIQHSTKIVSSIDHGEKVPCRSVKFDPKTVKNIFVDNKQEYSDELVTKKKCLGVKNPRPRNKRGENEDGAVDTGIKIPVICFICGRREEVSPALAISFSSKPEQNAYKCNSCSTPSGRQKRNG